MSTSAVRRWSRWPSTRTPTRRRSAAPRCTPRTSGLADYLAADEPDALRIGREIVGHLHWRKLGPRRAADPPSPRYDAGRAARRGQHRPARAVRRARDPRARRRRLAFEEFKPLYGTHAGHAAGRTLCGFPIGIVANNGILFSEESQKGAQFIQLCNRSDTPIAVRAERHRLHGRHALRAGRDHQGRRQADQRGVELDRAAPDADGRRVATARATTACPAARTTRASSSAGRTTASR